MPRLGDRHLRPGGSDDETKRTRAQRGGARVGRRDDGLLGIVEEHGQVGGTPGREHRELPGAGDVEDAPGPRAQGADDRLACET